MEMRKDKVLVMFSGGIDSTALLYILLSDPKYSHLDIHAHHINLVNKEKRADAELGACYRIVDYLSRQQYRKFQYTSNTFEYKMFQMNTPWDLDVVWFMAGLICQRYDNSINLIATGRTKSDTSNYPGVVERRKRGEALFELLASNRDYGVLPKFLPVLVDMEKSDIMRILPPELLSLTWSCRYPIASRVEDGTMLWQECRKCQPCFEIAQIKSGGKSNG
jgi:7-cyano-7-deazaguanine synthase in queuosine biosynthesis